MEIIVLSLFPKMFDGFLSESIIKRAIDKNIVNIRVINFRDYSVYNNNQVDDTPYGGGAGMVLMCDPIFRCLDEIRDDGSYVVLLSPEGNIYNQEKAREYKNIKKLIIICGHYEGFDERIKEEADEIVSVGDYILTGGEIGAMAIMDSVIRLVPGVINNESLDDESFNDGLLDYPVYTKPEEYRGKKVPSILLSGNHQKIKNYRHNERIRVTKEKRPDLLSEDV
ncbi:MAG: tRNA (guanosine(37)-N1)-methyltransferase TrmD [Tenericutes bacterium]|nr:tRNA (guanosine(37)-N1)-methyltransferase TrmD [Mycoplasmatota bacterium]